MFRFFLISCRFAFADADMPASLIRLRLPPPSILLRRHYADVSFSLMFTAHAFIIAADIF